VADLLQSVNERIRIVRVHDFLSPERVERTIEQHLAIVEALILEDLARRRSGSTVTSTSRWPWSKTAARPWPG
jgi:hypothetical protein